MAPLRRSSSSCSWQSGSNHSTKSSGSKNPQLEALADTFQRQLKEQGIIPNLQTKFSGADAVSTLQRAMNSQTDNATVFTREQAVEKANEMKSEFCFFQHVGKNKTMDEEDLEDSPSEYYIFHRNLPSQVRKTRALHKTHWDKVRLLEQHVEVKDRRHMFRVFQDCFIASEAVDVMMELQLVRSRKEAVHMMLKLNEKVFCCQHVCQEHDFEDKYLFFSFVPKHERMPEPEDSKRASKRASSCGYKTKTSRKQSEEKPVAESDESGRTEDASEASLPEEEERLRKNNRRIADDIKEQLARHKEEQRLHRTQQKLLN